MTDSEELGPYALLGQQPQEHQDKNITELKIQDYVASIDARSYFVTSGEAIAKAAKLEKDLWRAAADARKLHNALKKARGDATYLETSWHDGRLILKRKNKRIRKPK